MDVNNSRKINFQQIWNFILNIYIYNNFCGENNTRFVLDEWECCGEVCVGSEWCCHVGVEWRHWCTCWIQICQKDLDFVIELGKLVFINDNWNVKKMLHSKIGSPLYSFPTTHSKQKSESASKFISTIRCLHLSIITTIQC